MGEEEEETEPKYQLFVKGSDQPREEGSKWWTGDGHAIYLNKDEYIGSYVNGARSGKGTYKFNKNGDVYNGHYELNKKHGFGKMVFNNKKSEEEEEENEDEGPPRQGNYLGNFSSGLREGNGTFTYQNGDIYVGEWLQGKKHGHGTYTYAKDDTKLVGEWEKGKITSGKWIFPDGTFYCGKFRYNKPFGKGVWVFRDGNQLTGEYQQKKQQEEEEEAGDGDAENAEAQPVKVWCNFKPGKAAAIQGGNLFFAPGHVVAAGYVEKKKETEEVKEAADDDDDS